MVANAGSTIFTQVLVDLADMKATNNPSGRLVTHGLGSCVAVAIYDPEVRVGGLLHFMLPDSGLSRERALRNPFLFAGTGIPLLFRRVYNLGGEKERIVCKLAGASNVLDPDNHLNIGERNHLAAREILSKNNVTIHGEHVGGHSGMTLAMFMDAGRVMVTLPNGDEIAI